MTAWIEKFKVWWSSLGEREKKIVALGGCLFGIFILYQGLWKPYLTYLDTLRHRIEVGQKNLAWMQAADKKIQQWDVQTKKSNHVSTSLVVRLGVLQNQIHQAGLEPSLTQLKQADNERIIMQFQKIDFDKLIAFLITLAKTQGISVSQMSVVAENTPGIVSAAVTVF